MYSQRRHHLVKQCTLRLHQTNAHWIGFCSFSALVLRCFRREKHLHRACCTGNGVSYTPSDRYQIRRVVVDFQLHCKSMGAIGNIVLHRGSCGELRRSMKFNFWKWPLSFHLGVSPPPRGPGAGNFMRMRSSRFENSTMNVLSVMKRVCAAARAGIAAGRWKNFYRMQLGVEWWREPGRKSWRNALRVVGFPCFPLLFFVWIGRSLLCVQGNGGVFPSWGLTSSGLYTSEGVWRWSQTFVQSVCT